MLDNNQAVIEGRRAHGTHWSMAPELVGLNHSIE